jgi:hypothetical protein
MVEAPHVFQNLPDHLAFIVTARFGSPQLEEGDVQQRRVPPAFVGEPTSAEHADCRECRVQPGRFVEHHATASDHQGCREVGPTELHDAMRQRRADGLGRALPSDALD